MGVEVVPTSLAPLVGRPELVPDVFQAVGRDRAIELPGVVQRGHRRRRDRQPGRAAGEQRVADPSLGRPAFLQVVRRRVDDGLRDEEPGVVRGPEGLDLRHGHRPFVAGPGGVGPSPRAALALAGQRHRLADRVGDLAAERCLGDHAIDGGQEEQGEAMPVHRLTVVLPRPGDEPRRRAAPDEELDGALDGFRILAPCGRVPVREEGRSGQPGHRDRVGLAAAGDPRAVLGLGAGQVAQPLDHRAKRLRRHMPGEDLLRLLATSRTRAGQFATGHGGKPGAAAPEEVAPVDLECGRPEENVVAWNHSAPRFTTFDGPASSNRTWSSTRTGISWKRETSIRLRGTSSSVPPDDIS